MTLQDGDVVRFDYTLWIDDSDKPAETSISAVAQEHGFLNPEGSYDPLTVTLGARQIIPGLEEQLREKGKAGAKFTAEIPPEAAYGNRDPKNVKDVPMGQFRKQKVTPERGMILNFEGKRAIVTKVAGGRVRLDLNHELAGKSLRYDVEVKELITDTEGKAKAVLESIFAGGAPFTIDDDGISVDLPDGAKFDQQWPQHKFRLLTLLRQAVGIDMAIRLVETYPAMKPADEEE